MRKRFVLLLGALTLVSVVASLSIAAPASPTLGAQPAVTAPVPPPLTAEDKALAAVEDAGRRTVAGLLAQLQTATDPEAIRALERRVDDAKQAQRVEFLRTKIRFATERGDAVTLAEAQRVLDALLRPEAQPVAPAMPGPEKPAPEKGATR